LIPLDLASSGAPNSSHGMPMRYSWYPKVLCESVERIRRSRRLFGRVDPRLAIGSLNHSFWSLSDNKEITR
jgi:hypothetical protein